MTPPHSCSVKLNFYPRSPCGERLHYDNYNLHCVEISIHALLAESDPMMPSMVAILILFLSTLSLRRATASNQPEQQEQRISIHALLAESDQITQTCRVEISISIHALLAESDRCIFGSRPVS